MKAIAIDDEPMALEVVASHASKISFVDLRATFLDAFKAIEYLQKNPIDLLLLDIKMPDISGIELYKSLHPKPLVIFTTAYAEHAVSGFELDAVDYLLKPFSLARFLKACNKAYELHNLRNAGQPADHLYVKTGYEQVKLMFDDILYVEAMGNYVTFFLREAKVLSRSTFTEVLELLPAARFVRVHRSYVVGVSRIDKLERGQVVVGGRAVPVSERYYEGLMGVLKLS